MALNKTSGIDPKLVEKAYVGMKKHMSGKKGGKGRKGSSCKK